MDERRSQWRCKKNIYTSKQYHKWTLYRFLGRMSQFFFCQLGLVILITLKFTIIVLQHPTELTWILVIVFLGSQSLLMLTLLSIRKIQPSPFVAHQLYQLLIVLTQLICLIALACVNVNTSQTLSPGKFQGFIISWTIYYLPQLRFKVLLTISSSLLSLSTYAEYDLMLYEFFLICLASCFTFEYNQLAEYMKYVGLFSIIERIPNALCIVDEDKKMMLYSNEQFEKLATTLNQDIGQLFKDDSTRKEQIQLNFLQNLNLHEVRNDGFQISNILDQIDDEGITSDMYRIKMVQFRKNSGPSQRNSGELITPVTKSDNFRNSMHELQSLIHEQGSIQNKAFITDVSLHLELHHNPSNYIQSSLRKKHLQVESKRKVSYNLSPPQNFKDVNIAYRKKSSQLLVPGKSDQKSVNGLSVIEPLILDPQYSATPSGRQDTTTIPLVQHKMKFMVQLMENCSSLIQDEKLQIYFINELSPFLLKTKLNKLEQVKKNLLRSISHELVTYLNGAFGYLNQVQFHLQSQNFDREQISKWVNLSIQYLSLQIHKIQDIFDYKDYLSGQLELKKEYFQLKGALQECLDLVREHASQKGLQLNLVFDPSIQSLLQVHSDRQRLCQVVLNLLSNAIRFTFEGSVTVEVKRMQVETMRPDDQNFQFEEVDLEDIIQLSVIDTGLGMEYEQLQTLTKKLMVNSDEKVSKDSVGVGMGLLICKYLLKMMGPDSMNALFVQSNKNEGSRFYFFLKRVKQRFYERSFGFDRYKVDGHAQKKQSQSSDNIRASCERAEVGKMQVLKPNILNFYMKDLVSFKQPLEQSYTNISDCQCMRVLLVDDEHFNIEVLSYFMNQLGFQCELGYNGKQALERIEQRKQRPCSSIKCSLYRCILMDLNMPVMNGWQAANKIRSLEKLNAPGQSPLPTIPIIAVTAFGSPQDQAKCLSSGFDLVLLKPVSISKLREAFEKLHITTNKD